MTECLILANIPKVGNFLCGLLDKATSPDLVVEILFIGAILSLIWFFWRR